MPKQEVVEVKKNELAGAQQLSITPSDIDIPRLNIVQKTSSIDGPVGSVVLDKTHILMVHLNQLLKLMIQIKVFYK